MSRYIILSILVFCMIFVNCECGKKNPTKNDDPTITEILSSGWAKFSAEDYSGAETAFDEAITKESGNFSANTGKGWSMLMQNKEDLAGIVSYLQKAVSDNTWQSDARCGLAVTKLIQKQYSDVITMVELVISAQTDYFFQYRPSIDYHDLLVIKAQAYFLSKQYTNAWQTVLQLTSEYSLDPNNSDSWVVNGAEYFSFEAALSEVIEILSNTYRN